MHAERLILETDDEGRLIGVPSLPRNSRVEAIFLLLPAAAGSEGQRRTPPPQLAGKVKIVGDITASILSDDDWGMLR